VAFVRLNRKTTVLNNKIIAPCSLLKKGKNKVAKTQKHVLEPRRPVTAPKLVASTSKVKPKGRDVAGMLGLDRLSRLTVENCKARASELEKRIEKGEFSSDEMKLAAARKWSHWYQRKAVALEAVSGTKKASKKTARSEEKDGEE
jgi:hypothetical protein